ncbi:hypothetical protein [Reyranella sp.]|uniref:hypothetical protein n=1 Tax=Reyranella sp. TaxID=1929291 RepID=UPI00273134F0|nr:hypothetical protein [Reyranella sp.]MDP2378443.1 hypothetical protein [Reyranella sp.]
MNEPNEPGAEAPGAETYVLPEIRVTPEIHVTPDRPHAVEPTDDTAPPAAVAPREPPAEEPPIVRHDPFAYMRGARWMDRRLSPSGRAAVLLRRDLEAFPVIEGRDPNHADLDAIVKRTVDYIVPIIRREQATDFVYEELEKRREERIAKARAASLAPPAVGEVAKAAARGVASLLAVAPAGVLAPAVGAAIALRPTTPEDGTFGLGEDLRLRTPSGSLEGEIERRVGDRWESSGIRAALNSGLGARVLVDDVAGFSNAVGAQLADRLQSQGVVGERPRRAATGGLGSVIRWTPPGDLSSLDALGPGSDRLPISELRMLAKDEVGTRFGDVTRAEAEQFCPNYSRIQAFASEAGRIARLEGPTSHRQYGQRTHRLATLAIREADAMRKLLELDGVPELSADVAIFDGGLVKFRNVRGSAIIDVFEKMTNGDICIHDIKTGGAHFRDRKMELYLEQATKRFPHAVKIYVLPIYVEDMFGRDHNRK